MTEFENRLHKEVNHPPHYQSKTGLEVIEVIEAFELDYYRGNAIKYILRAGKKKEEDTVIDLEKAMWYLKRFITQQSKE